MIDEARATRIEKAALAYLALPNAIFLYGWIVSPFGPIAAAVVVAAVIALTMRRNGRNSDGLGVLGVLAVPIIAIAGLWTLLGGVGHFVHANTDWVVRDAVLLDLAREPWPVSYVIDGVEMLLRAPIGFFLPAALVGKLLGVRAAELALLAWTVGGVALVFALLMRDRPTLRTAMIRVAVFIVFSGADILGTIAHYNPRALGEHLEWWALLFQYSSHTTQLFWVPNHALPGWIAIAWLVTQDPGRLSIATAVLMAAFAPLWSPLTAIGIAPFIAVAIVRHAAVAGAGATLRRLVDLRLLLVVAACALLIYPYLTAGSGQVASGSNAQLRWVGEDFGARVVEFLVFECAGFVALLLIRNRRDPLLWTAVAVLLALPFYRFGPYNDLAMRASIPALAVLAIELGRWLSQPLAATRDPVLRAVAVVLLAIGAVTPTMEIARAVIEPRRPMDIVSSVVDVTRGTHYLTPRDHPWIRRFLGPPP